MGRDASLLEDQKAASLLEKTLEKERETDQKLNLTHSRER
jgi:ferritin-like metal-binding protein YciE